MARSPCRQGNSIAAGNTSLQPCRALVDHGRSCEVPADPTCLPRCMKYMASRFVARKSRTAVNSCLAGVHASLQLQSGRAHLEDA